MIAYGILVLLISQFWNFKNFNEGSEIILSEKNIELKRISSQNELLIKKSFDVLKHKASINHSDKIISDLKNKNIDVSIFVGQKPEFWTNNSINIRPQYYSEVVLQKHLGDYITLIPYLYKDREFVFTYTLIKNPEFSFFDNQISSFKKGNKFNLEQNPLEGSIHANINGLPSFYLSIEEYSEPITWSIISLFSIFFICLGVYRCCNKPHRGVFMIALILIVCEFLFFKNYILWNLKSSRLFAPEIFASDWLAPNLGVFLFNNLLFLAAILYLSFYLKQISIPKKIKENIWIRSGLILGIGAYSGILFRYIGKLVNDSSLSFDFYEIFLFNIYTFIALIIILVGFLIFFSLLSFLHLIKPKKSKKNSIILIFLFSLVFVFTWILTTLNISLFSTSNLIIFYFINQSQWRMSIRIAFRIVIACAMVSMVFQSFSAEKDLFYRDTIARKLLLQNEKKPQVKLGRTEVLLSKDLGVLDYYTCDDISKTKFESRIRQVYFNTFTDNFETQIFDFDSNNNSYREQNSYSFTEIDTLFNSNSCKPISNHFALVTNKKLKGSYLGKFEAYTDTSFYGTYYVLMKPILNNSPGKLSQLFDKSSFDALFSQNQYSFAIYSQNRLSRRFGNYNYNIEFGLKEKYYTQEGYSHYVFKDNLDNKIIVSKPERNWLQNISSFTMLVLCCLLFVLLYQLFLMIKQFIQTKITGQKKDHNFAEFLKQNFKIPFWNKLYLSNKLQLYVVGVVFITFCVILFVTVRYFNNSNQTRQIKHLWDKSTEIANTISTRANLQAIFKRNENNILYDLSNYYNTDINLFGTDGKLQFSSNSKIFDQGLIGRLMKPEVYRKLKFNKKSGVVNSEKLGSLNYIASYLSIFDNDLNLKGYINLPYFTNEQDLIREISNYSATLINLFVLIFALAAILAYLIGQQIIKPLDTIRKELSLVKLGKEYTPLKYKNNDEIGLLISEYNKMLTELEYSSNKLAESERQGAWREMAKQVAHEIKNPLTPMKLSLQHLQLAIQRKDEKLDEKVTRTSQLLIDQIESLSKMAEEFSSFAKMPEAKNATVDVGEELNKACELFSRKKGISIKKSIPQKILTAHIDSQQMGRVFNNIIKNAIQSIPKDKEGLIEASIKSEGSSILITLKDNGKGIPPELFSKIFSPNFSTKNSGMGLGLAISKKIIEQFNGSIRFESEKDIGTVFFIKLPLNSN